MDNKSNELLMEKAIALLNKIKEITTLQDTTIKILNSTMDNKTESRHVLTEQFFCCVSCSSNVVHLFTEFGRWIKQTSLKFTSTST